MLPETHWFVASAYVQQSCKLRDSRIPTNSKVALPWHTIVLRWRLWLLRRTDSKHFKICISDASVSHPMSSDPSNNTPSTLASSRKFRRYSRTFCAHCRPQAPVSGRSTSWMGPVDLQLKALPKHHGDSPSPSTQHVLGHPAVDYATALLAALASQHIVHVDDITFWGPSARRVPGLEHHPRPTLSLS